MPNAGKCKWILQGKGFKIQINNKTVIIIVGCEELLRSRFVLSAIAFGFGR